MKSMKCFGIRRLAIIMAFLLAGMVQATAQRFFNLTADEVKIDTVLPHFTYSYTLPDNYTDSIYTVSIAYPEFIDMTSNDIARYNSISGAMLPETPTIYQQIVVSRRKGSLEVSFCPLVYRNQKYQVLVSFMLRVESKPVKRSMRKAAAATRSGLSSRYAEHSVLASGKWAKIRVPSTGIYQLTNELIRKAGFTDLDKVKVYGYGGALLNEALTEADLVAHDDLKEVPTCTLDGKRVFFAQGPVSWASKSATIRTRNPYSDFGYYFITQSDDEPLTQDSTSLLNQLKNSYEPYHDLFEIDNFAWYQGGRNLFYDDAIKQGASKDYTLTTAGLNPSGHVCVSVSAGVSSTVQVLLNDSVLGNMNIYLGSYDAGNMQRIVYSVNNLQATNKVTVKAVSGGPVRLDFVSCTYDRPESSIALPTTFDVPEYVYNITNQDHHTDSAADMVIIIPTSQKLLAQAQRLKTFHELHDSLRVNIVPADELFNEFSSGTPDASAYRHYLKMLYDRAESDDDMPRYLLLFGDCVWDNRMVTSACKSLDSDDYLLCYESENSFNDQHCYVDDGFFCLLDDGEGANILTSDKLDMAVGRFPVTTEAEAKILVDKTINYASRTTSGAWENTLVFLGDDGDDNLHMTDMDEAAEQVRAAHPDYLIKKVPWDAYTMVSSANGNTYPELTKYIKRLNSEGALIFDYTGHGRIDMVSHEAVLKLNDFEEFKNTNLPLWITASCDLMPFDGTVATIGESTVLNSQGGAVAFFGTTRTVSSLYNARINKAYLKYVLNFDNGKAITIGEAQRLAKNEMITTGQDRTDNKLQYSLLGDPALSLNLPKPMVVIDSINGIAVSSLSSPITLPSGSVARVSGHVEGASGFNGVVTATVLDSRELITCKLNNKAQADTPFQYYDRNKIIFSGNDSIRDNQFSVRFAVPKDLNYANETGMITLFAINNERDLSAHGRFEQFILGGSDSSSSTSKGPSIYCYLNSPSFVDGGDVNTTPYFVAQISDEDGINVSGNGIGHDLQLIIDGDYTMTYNLNDNFQYDFGSYTSGTTFYSLPKLSLGKHKLQFRAWDVLNNSSTTELTFNVVSGLKPTIFSTDVTNNPATTTTTFIITHDRVGGELDVTIDLFDMSGRQLWKHSETGVSDTGAYTVTWDLTLSNGSKLQTGVYIYRASISSDGSKRVSKAKKLIVISNN